MNTYRIFAYIIYGISILNLYACTDGNSTPSFQVIRGPYLQTPTETSINIKWRTSSPSKPVIYYGLSPNAMTSRLISKKQRTDHEQVLVDLRPDTQYYYYVSDIDTPPISTEISYTFRTTPPLGVPHYHAVSR